jgi:hypothetical protein
LEWCTARSPRQCRLEGNGVELAESGMRIFNRAHLPWFIFVLLATTAAGLLYLNNFRRLSLPIHLPRLTGDTPGYVNVGATPLGLIFGSVAFAIFIFAGLLGLRKKIPLWRIGTVQGWLCAHVWLTLLTIPLVILHTGFRLGGPMTTLLLLLYGVVMLSGIYGLALQHYLPKLMKEKLPAEIVYEQIPYVRAQLCRAAENIRDALKGLPPRAATPPVTNAQPAAVTTSVTALTRSTTAVISAVTAADARDSRTQTKIISRPSEPRPGTAAGIIGGADASTSPRDVESEAVLLDFLEAHALPYLRKPRASRKGLSNPSYSEDMFRFLRLRTAEPYQAWVGELQSLCEERGMLDYQTRLQHWLHRWLFVHVPLSYLLILMTAWHAFLTLFRY